MVAPLRDPGVHQLARVSSVAVALGRVPQSAAAQEVLPPLGLNELTAEVPPGLQFLAEVPLGRRARPARVDHLHTAQGERRRAPLDRLV